MKPMNIDEFFNRRVIFSGLEARFNYDDTTDSPGITEGQIETEVVAEVLQK